MSPVLRDRYRLEDRLGSGGMADVHRATDTTLQRSVAVKVLRDAAGEESDRARFVTEARTLASLSHRNLVTVLDAGIGDEDDRPFLVMELVEGQTLSAALRDGPLPPERVARTGAEVAAGLAYAHGRGVVHRDVKPANVLLGAEGRVKLADFGIARLIGDTVRHTRTGTAIGTAAYLAPEQVRGEDVTGATDVYALGLVLLEALTGERAFPGSPTEAALARLHRDPEVPPDLPDGWPALLTAMTAADPESRPTADEVARVCAAGATAGGVLPALAAGASSTPTDLVGAGGHDEATPPTAVLTAPVATAVVPTAGAGAAVAGAGATGAGAGSASAAEPSAAAVPALDRAGDSLARLPGRLRQWWVDLAPHHRGVAGALAGLVLLVLVATLAAGGGATSDPVDPSQPDPVQAPLDFSQVPGSGGQDDAPATGSDGTDEDQESEEPDEQERPEQSEEQREKTLEKLEKQREKMQERLEKQGDDD